MKRIEEDFVALWGYLAIPRAHTGLQPLDLPPSHQYCLTVQETLRKRMSDKRMKVVVVIMF